MPLSYQIQCFSVRANLKMCLHVARYSGLSGERRITTGLLYLFGAIRLSQSRDGQKQCGDHRKKPIHHTSVKALFIFGVPDAVESFPMCPPVRIPPPALVCCRTICTTCDRRQLKLPTYCLTKECY